jgi:serine/threonine-protein kinase
MAPRPVDHELHESRQEALGDSCVLEHELAAGMGRVFLATDTHLGRRIVVKVVRPEMTEAISAERFRREIQVAARLQQANIVPILSAGGRGRLAYYTMPYVEGESLRHRMLSGRLPMAEIISILRDVARAVSAS